MESSLVVEVNAGVDVRYHDALSRLFEISFGPVRGDTAFGEGNDGSRFVRLIDHPSVRCFIAFDSAREPIGFAALTRDIRRIDWVEPGFYESRYRAAIADGRFYYLPYVLVHPRAQALGLVRHLFDRVVDELVPKRAVVGFDVSLANVALVDIFRASMERAMGHSTVALVDTHSFFVAPLDGSSAELLNRTPEMSERL